MKQTLVSEERVIEEVKKSIGESLRINSASIATESSLVDDLGAESLDFLDINYRVEQIFGIKLARQLVLEHVEEIFGEGAAVDDGGRLTERGAQLLKIRWGDSAAASIRPGMELHQVTTVITVRAMANGILDILDTLPEKCVACSSSSWKSEDGARIRCGKCGKDATFTNGDDLLKAWLRKVQDDQKIF
jgi:acyl carrier protein